MSWLRSTISKVRESGEAIKQSAAIRSLQEKTTTVVTSAAQQVKKAKEAVRGGASSASELEAQLEQRARSTKTAAALAELHRHWVQCINSREGYRSDDSERLLGFKEVLLRCRALEITIEAIVVDPTLRKCYSEILGSQDQVRRLTLGGEGSPVAALHALLGKTMACPEQLWVEMLRIGVSDDGPGTDGNAGWLTGIVTAIKIDWQEESLASERKELALRTEYLRQEIKQLDVAQDKNEPVHDRHKRRVEFSSELLQIYQGVRRNLAEAQEHRQASLGTREGDLNLIAEQIQSHMVGLQSTASSSNEKHRHLEGELKQSHESIQQQLQHMGETRTEIDRDIEQLEQRKKALRIELDEVSRLLDETRMKQRQHMESCDAQQKELEHVKVEFRSKLDAEEGTAKEAERQKASVERAQQLVKDTDAAVQCIFGSQLEELKKKQAQFNDHFQGLLKDHFSFAEEQAKALRARADVCRDEPEGLGLTEIGDVAESAQAARLAFQEFRELHGALLGEESELAAQRIEDDLSAAFEACRSRADVAAQRPNVALQPTSSAATEATPPVGTAPTTPAASCSTAAPEVDASTAPANPGVALLPAADPGAVAATPAAPIVPPVGMSVTTLAPAVAQAAAAPAAAEDAIAATPAALAASPVDAAVPTAVPAAAQAAALPVAEIHAVPVSATLPTPVVPSQAPTMAPAPVASEVGAPALLAASPIHSGTLAAAVAATAKPEVASPAALLTTFVPPTRPAGAAHGATGVSTESGTTTAAAIAAAPAASEPPASISVAANLSDEAS